MPLKHVNHSRDDSPPRLESVAYWTAMGWGVDKGIHDVLQVPNWIQAKTIYAFSI